MLQLDGDVDEVFLNVTPLHKTEPFIQDELKTLQTSVRRGDGDSNKKAPLLCL